MTLTLFIQSIRRKTDGEISPIYVAT